MSLKGLATSAECDAIFVHTHLVGLPASKHDVNEAVDTAGAINGHECLHFVACSHDVWNARRRDGPREGERDARRLDIVTEVAA